MTCATVVFGSAEYIRITRNENSRVRAFKSHVELSRSPFILHPSAFILPTTTATGIVQIMMRSSDCTS